MYVYEEIREELKKNRYVIYKIEKKKFELVFKFNGKKSELKEKITKKYLKKDNTDLFFVCFKFSFHTGTKDFQGGPLAVNLSTFAFLDGELTSGRRKNELCDAFVYKVWFQRKWLEKFGWKDSYLDRMITKLLNKEVKLYPLLENLYNVKFS